MIGLYLMLLHTLKGPKGQNIRILSHYIQAYIRTILVQSIKYPINFEAMLFMCFVTVVEK